MKNLKWVKHEDLAIRRSPSVGRAEYLDHMTFQSNLLPLFTEIFGPLVGLKEEWEEQGASAAELDFSAFQYRCENRGFLPVNTGREGGFPEFDLLETDEFLLFKDGLGRTMKQMKGISTLPLPLDYPVKNMDDWLKIKPWYQFNEERFHPEWLATANQFQVEDRVICISIPGGFDEPRQLLGEERLCLGYYEQPELIQDILETVSHTVCQVLERVTSQVQIDLLFVHEDMAGKAGPLIGPRLVETFIAPYYQRAWEIAQDRGARLFDQDSDGDMNAVIPAFLATGVNCMHPMEPAAHMNVVEIRRKYGQQLAFYGGIDKHVLRQSQADILSEIDYKLPPLLLTGGCVFALDHRIPNGTPLENYRFYVSKMWEILNSWSR